MHLRCGPFRWPRRCAGAPMQHDQQGFVGSHWTPPLGNFALQIAPLAARAPINSTMMQHVLTLLAVSMAIAMRRYYTTCIAQWRRFVAFIKATKCHHRTSTGSLRYHKRDTVLSGWLASDPLLDFGRER